MTDRPFRFGVVAGHVPDLAALTGLAGQAEELGFDTLVTPDPVSGHDPLTVLAAVAATTERLRFGTFVLAEPFRDHRQLAWQARTLHRLSGGRFELGLGTGRPNAAGHAASLGRDFASAGNRLAGLAELIGVIKQDTDRPPLLLAASGPKMIELAAREADVVTLSWGPKTTNSEALSVVDRFRAAVGDRAGEVELAMNLIAVGDAPAPQVERYTGVSVDELAASGAVTVLRGTPSEAAQRIRRWRAELGVSYFSVNGEFLNAFAPVVAELRGT
ncbi:LLM class flavin-dependent oxidoreductase [Amycolatopsis sp. CA-230715]|uniref:LLM class flavin-dependent oxidoreductase n=1 Tax=Amycolatopsis sp. CA-230715 TaxID=2745196 RepID=UPI001C011770|nr:LLM class flavin-dependent oxidoreductase [Amycolatopsis sp. CA-230715]QWF84663.1 Alkanesulfonate monooxygenase [Amycolatopsis sp. CA-230715]